MQKPHFDTSMSYPVHYHLHNKTMKIYGHVHSILLVIYTTGIKRIEAKLTQKNWIVKRWYIVKVVSNDSIFPCHVLTCHKLAVRKGRESTVKSVK